MADTSVEPDPNTDTPTDVGAETRNPSDLAATTPDPTSSISNVSHMPPERTTPQPHNTSQSWRIDDLKQVLNVLRAYVLTFGRPDSEIELRAVIGAIAANIDTVAIANPQLERFMDEAIAAFASLGMEADLVDVTAQLLAEQVSVWLREQETTVLNTLSAYLQRFAPEDTVWSDSDLLNLIQTVIATLNDGSLSRSGGRVLVEQVLAIFDLEQALTRWVAPEWIALAQQVASYFRQNNIQLEVRSIAWAYLQQFQSILSPQLIEQILENGPITVSPAELLAGDLGDFSQMLYYKFQLLEADPVVTRSHQSIAADVRRAAAKLNASREPRPDVTTGVQTGDFEISSPFSRTDT